MISYTMHTTAEFDKEKSYKFKSNSYFRNDVF